MELREVIIGKLKDVMTTPEVSVIVVEPRSYKVSIIGEVARPGLVVLRSQTTMLELLAMVGGVTQFASRRNIFVLRKDGTAQKKISFNYNRALSADPEQENFYLQPNDLVVIP
jgi:polysaccharide export outer membrane protein